jgi:DNA-directed RNA polymerase subunit L
MEITLEKIELVKDRTGVSYKEAKEALEANGGSVVDAIISIEEAINNGDSNKFGDQGTAIVESLKEIVKKGNVSKIVVKKEDGEVLLNVPVNVGILGVVVAPWGMIVAAIAAFGFKCVIEVVKDDGTVIDVTDKTTEAVEKATDKGSEAVEKVKSSEAYEKMKKKTSESFFKASETLKSKFSKVKEEVEDFADEFEDVFEFEEVKDEDDVNNSVETEKTIEREGEDK